MTEEAAKRDVFKPYPFKKVRFVEDDYLEKVEKYVYNDLKGLGEKILPYKDFYNEDAIKKLNLQFEYVRLGEPLETCILTKDGQIYNTKNKTTKKVQISTYNIVYANNGATVDFKHTYKLLGWEFDHSKIVENYNRGNWPYYNNIKVGSRKKNRKVSSKQVKLYNPIEKEKP